MLPAATDIPLGSLRLVCAHDDALCRAASVPFLSPVWPAVLAVMRHGPREPVARVSASRRPTTTLPSRSLLRLLWFVRRRPRSRTIDLYATSVVDGCLPVGAYSFETTVSIVDDGATQTASATWGFSLTIESLLSIPFTRTGAIHTPSTITQSFCSRPQICIQWWLSVVPRQRSPASGGCGDYRERGRSAAPPRFDGQAGSRVDRR